jgi:hypothetical protein
VAGFRFLLVLPDGEPADPALFPTVIPTWRVGDEFPAGPKLQRFRILAIEPVRDPQTARETFDAVWIVEPADA